MGSMMLESGRGHIGRDIAEEKVDAPDARCRTGEERPVSDPPSDAPDQPVRAIDEDDDGYDPYSDLHRRDPFFEEDPWR